MDGCRDRNIGFQVVARRTSAVSAAVAAANDDTDRWVPALRADGSIEELGDGHPVAMVAAVTDLVDVRILDGWPTARSLLGAYQQIAAFT